MAISGGISAISAPNLKMVLMIAFHHTQKKLQSHQTQEKSETVNSQKQAEGTGELNAL